VCRRCTHLGQASARIERAHSPPTRQRPRTSCRPRRFAGPIDKMEESMDPLTALAIALGAGATIILFGAGYGSGPSSTLTGSPPPAADGSCASLCKTWTSWRASACLALAAASAAGAALAAANAALASALAAAALLLAAAVAASMIPFVGLAIAPPLWAAYFVAQALVIFLMGRQAAAAQGARTATGDVTVKLAGVSAALADLRRRCTNQTALATCLATPSPCSGVP
jgi:hypothetical protein